MGLDLDFLWEREILNAWTQYFEVGIFVALVLVANEGASHYSDKLQLGGWRDFYA